MPTTKGDKTYNHLLKSESHKLHEEFTVKTGQAVDQFGLVVLNSDGTVQKAAADATAKTVLGYSVHPGAAEELVTVACKGYAQIFGFASGGAITAGPVKVAAAANATGYCGYANTAGDTSEDNLIVGWAMDAGGQDDVVRIMMAV